MSAVFITGAQVGTGYGIAELFAKQGWDVFITSRRGNEAEASAKKLSETYGVFAKGYECNIRNEQQVIDIFNDIDKTGRFVEAVILNAANIIPRTPQPVKIFGLFPLKIFRRFLKQTSFGTLPSSVRQRFA